MVWIEMIIACWDFWRGGGEVVGKGDKSDHQ